HLPRGKVFSPRVEFLEAKPAGNGSLWDEERMLQPERAYPCVDSAAAEYHGRNSERGNRPAWKPTIANRRSGMGNNIGTAFPLPPRPRSALRTPRARPPVPA
ncbi:unnamed protein product, partial [Polarella glacialis]